MDCNPEQITQYRTHRFHCYLCRHRYPSNRVRQSTVFEDTCQVESAKALGYVSTSGLRPCGRNMDCINNDHHSWTGRRDCSIQWSPGRSVILANLSFRELADFHHSSQRTILVKSAFLATVRSNLCCRHTCVLLLWIWMVCWRQNVPAWLRLSVSGFSPLVFSA